jgi:integral membrane protein
VTRTLAVYRVFATVVGVFLIILVLIGLPLNELHRLSPGLFPLGSTPQHIGELISAVLGTLHGFLYMGFLVVAFLLSRQARWSIAFTLVTLVCGTIPILSFWAERRATRQVRGLLAGTTPPAGGTPSPTDEPPAGGRQSLGSARRGPTPS